MTKHEAKEITLEVWRYIAEHNLSSKKDLPVELFSKIEKLTYNCPLCHVLQNCFTDCPLNKPEPCFYCESFYFQWCNTNNSETRKKSAQNIVGAVEAWNPGENL